MFIAPNVYSCGFESERRAAALLSDSRLNIVVRFYKYFAPTEPNPVGLLTRQRQSLHPLDNLVELYVFALPGSPIE